ncbi:PfkB family carbohydrate kinase [Cellulomonas sp. NPDC089187]|uniref:1-phosphofructokinase family hexose kinase n=1 Tax=Cellulomonas sp. NPDC089187 TaxID=3154970 RepID=UPI00343C93BB
MAVSRSPRVCVVAPTPILTLTIESGAQDQDTELHVHPGGQGLWVARMAYSLGADVVLCGPFGGETGTVLSHLAEKENLRVRAIGTAGSNGAYLHDRRGGERQELAFMPPSRLDRHEIDDLYGTALVEALDADVCVITGAFPATVLPGSFFGRLVGDLRAAGVKTVADLSGDAARQAVASGVDVLKMSHSELVEAELAADDSVAALTAGARRLIEPRGDEMRGVGAVMVSRAAEPALLVTAAHVREVVAPSVTTVDHRGAGDSMTAGIAVAVGRGLGMAEAARLGAAAGALNVTRRGLGTGHREQIERFAEQISVHEVDEDGRDRRAGAGDQ